MINLHNYDSILSYGNRGFDCHGDNYHQSVCRRQCVKPNTPSIVSHGVSKQHVIQRNLIMYEKPVSTPRSSLAGTGLEQYQQIERCLTN